MLSCGSWLYVAQKKTKASDRQWHLHSAHTQSSSQTLNWQFSFFYSCYSFLPLSVSVLPSSVAFSPSFFLHIAHTIRLSICSFAAEITKWDKNYKYNRLFYMQWRQCCFFTFLASSPKRSCLTSTFNIIVPDFNSQPLSICLPSFADFSFFIHYSPFPLHFLLLSPNPNPIQHSYILSHFHCLCVCAPVCTHVCDALVTVMWFTEDLLTSLNSSWGQLTEAAGVTNWLPCFSEHMVSNLRSWILLRTAVTVLWIFSAALSPLLHHQAKRLKHAHDHPLSRLASLSRDLISYCFSVCN